MILRQEFLLLLLLLLLKSTTSHPSQKRDTSFVSISKSSRNVIDDGNPVNSEPASFSPHAASPPYYHLKEVIGNAVNVHKFHNWRTVSSMIVGSSISASPEHGIINVGEAPPDTTKPGAQTVNIPPYNSFISNESKAKTIKILGDGSMNSQADPDETTITKPIKSSIEIVPALSRRGIDFKLPNWNFSGWRGWKGLKGWTKRISGAPQDVQKPPNMQKFEGSRGIQPGQISRNSMTKSGVNSNNRIIAGPRHYSGVRVGRVRAVGHKGSRASLRNKAKTVKDDSPMPPHLPQSQM